MSSPRRVRVGVLGAGAWARGAHLPGLARDPRCELVAIADPSANWRAEAAAEFGIPLVGDSPEALIARDDLDLIDVCTPSQHALRAVVGGARSRASTCSARSRSRSTFATPAGPPQLARAKGLKTKLGFTFRYAPAMRYMRQLVDEGFVGTPFIFNGYEQNSQWIDPQNPLRQVDPARRPERSCTSPRSRATARRSSTSAHLVVGSGPHPASSARCATSSPSGWSAPPGG